mmetsp:Transcript_5221/g.8917  ORF Transcript_5221/g.8917 Transcript_5221/m.8917 type:complete len:213 (+) Transcript_5221:578-1216(+)
MLGRLIMLVRGRHLHRGHIALIALLHEAGDFLLQKLDNVPNERSALLKVVRDFVNISVLLPGRVFGFLNLLLDLGNFSRFFLLSSGLGTLCFSNALRATRVDGRLQLVVLNLNGFNVSVQLIDISQETEVSLFQTHKDLHNFLNVADLCAGFNGGKGLFEDLDVLHVLLDMPALDGVEEADLQNPPVHGALRKGFFLIRHHEVLPPRARAPR